MEWFVLIFVFAICWIAIRRERHSYLKQKAKFKFYALRDKLRRNAIDGNISADDWVFDYFDTTLSRLVGAMDFLNIYYILHLLTKHEDDKVVNSFRSKLNSRITNTAFYKDLQLDMIVIYIQYLKNKHYFLFKTLKALSVISDKIKENREQKSSEMRNAIYFPELSTSYRFA